MLSSPNYSVSTVGSQHRPMWHEDGHDCTRCCICTRQPIISWHSHRQRHWVASRKVAGSIPDGVIGIFHWP